MKSTTLLIGMVFLIANGQALKLPSDLQMCNFGDTDCVTNTIVHILADHAQTGVKELNLIPFEPLHVKSLKLERNAKSPVNIELSFKDIDLFGLASAKIEKVQGFTTDFEKPIIADFSIPEIVLKGPYKIDGNVLILPIVGEGESEVKLDNVKLRLKTKNKVIEKDGKKYVDIEKVKLEIKPKKVHFKFTGLFNGNKELGDNMNVFLNENWKDIFGELEPSIAEAIGLILRQILNNVYSKYPYEEFFLKQE